MRILLDSHTVIWAVDAPSFLGQRAEAELRSSANDILVSAATIWEIAIKCGRGKLSLALPYRSWMAKAVSALGATILPISIEYADMQASLPNLHGDPFDRLLIAQSLAEQIPLLSRDTTFDLYGVNRIW